MWGWGRNVRRYDQCLLFGAGAYALSLSMHVSLLCFFRLWEIADDIGDIDQGSTIVLAPLSCF
jgi:hypothetical protein